MPKATWGELDGSPWDDDLDDIPIYDGELPPKGIYRCAMKFLRLKKNRNNDPMLNGLLVVNEPAGSKKAQYNGYDFWFNLNVTNQGSRWVNNFLSAIVPEAKVAAVRKAFWEQKVMIDKGEPPNVLSIGGVKIVENMLVTVQCGRKTYEGDDALDAKRFIRPTDMTFNADGASEATETEEEDWEETETEEEVTEEDGEEVSEEEAAREEELAEMKRPALLKLCKELDITGTRGKSEDDIIGMILDVEFGEEEEGEEEEPEEEMEEEEVAEEEPEPAKPARRSRKASTPPPPPPARAKTGTRRRRAASGEPPF